MLHATNFNKLNLKYQVLMVFKLNHTWSIQRFLSNYNIKLKKILNDMSQDNRDIFNAQKQRNRIKEKGSKYIPGTVNLQVLGSGSLGSPASIYLFTDQTRYLFNCGEGTQRLAHEHKTKLSRLEHVFLTRTSWNRIGGLPGLSLTLQDAGVPNLTLHGPNGLEELFSAMRKFVILKDLKVNSEVCLDGDSYEDSVMSVKYVSIYKDESNISKTGDHFSTNTKMSLAPDVDDTDYYAHESNSNVQNDNEDEKQNDFYKNYKGNTYQDSVVAYVCKLKPRPGALCLEKCVDKGVPPGPLLGQLKNGHNITLPNGTTVYASDVKAPDDPGPVFIVIDIPSIEYLENLKKSNKSFENHQITASHKVDVASLIVHFSPPEIMDTSIYKEFIAKFPINTSHFIVNSSNKFSGYVALHRIQCQLNQLNSNIFPMLNECNNSLQENEITEPPIKKIKLLKNKIDSSNKEPSDEYIMGEPVSALTCYHLRPNRGIDRTNEVYIDTDEYINETKLLPNFLPSLNELKNKFNNVIDENKSQEYPKIVFLGTGSCIPNKTRNVSSILIHTNEHSCILLDCGEGTHGQIVRFYGENESTNILRKLKAVYISHLHADHHIGLIGILQNRHKILQSNDNPLLLFAPKQISSWLYFYNNQIEQIQSNYRLYFNGDMNHKPYSCDDLTAMSIKNLNTCLVRHCPHAFGISITLNISCINETKPFVITYSGDTMPCDDLLKIGENCTILIHEATMEDELEDQAKIKMHSTISQAIEQGRKMNAEFIVLTHFSQRYAKLPRIMTPLCKNVCIAFDNMNITPLDLKHLHEMYPTLKILFAEHCEEMDQKALKRAYKIQRNS